MTPDPYLLATSAGYSWTDGRSDSFNCNDRADDKPIGRRFALPTGVDGTAAILPMKDETGGF